MNNYSCMNLDKCHFLSEMMSKFKFAKKKINYLKSFDKLTNISKGNENR